MMRFFTQELQNAMKSKRSNHASSSTSISQKNELQSSAYCIKFFQYVGTIKVKAKRHAVTATN